MWLNKIKDLFWPEATEGKVVKKPSRRAMAMESLLNLEQVQGKKFSYQMASVTMCQCSHKNLLEFVENLSKLNQVVRSDKAVSPVDANCVVEKYSVRELLINKGFFIPLDVVKLFIVESKDLCKLLESGDNALSGKMAHNQRVLAAHLGAIREVSNALTECYNSKF